MSGQSFIAVDGTLADVVAENASLLDFHNQGLNFLATCQAFAQESKGNNDITYDEKLYAEIAGSFKQFAAIPDKEFESAVNLTIHILTFSQSFSSHVVQFMNGLIQEFNFTDKIVKNNRRFLKVVSIISILTNVFNLADLNSASKLTIFDRILDLVAVANNPELLVPIVDQMESLLQIEEQEFKQEKRLFLVRAAKLVKPIEELKALKLYKCAILRIPGPSPELVEEYLVESMNATKEIDITHIIEDCSSVQIPTSYKSLMQDYLSLPATEFQAKLPSYQSVSSSLDLAQITKKNQYLTLARLALNKNKLSLDQIAQALNLKVDEVELFIFDAIKSKIIEGKISQVDKSFSIFRVLLVVKATDMQDWLEIKSTLLEWRGKLKEVRGLIELAQKQKTEFVQKQKKAVKA